MTEEAERNGIRQAFADEVNIGLTKREYFAGLAMQGLLANPKLTDDYESPLMADAVSYADSLLEALSD